MTDAPKTSAKVKSQYEELPYPFRDPEDEKTRLVAPFSDCPDFINHTCYGGAKDFTKPVRILIAGGGTGDAMLFWAENLRNNKDAEIVYLDFSSASRKVAEARLKVHGLDNVKFITDSLLNIPNLNLGKFDFINSSGVLHHLEKPEDGIKALASALKDDGVIAIMIYGTYGRYGVYPIQELMRIINKGEDDKGKKVDNAITVLSGLPSNNYFIQNIKSIATLTTAAEIYDLFLHDQDRAYTIPETYDFAKAGGLEIVEFFSAYGQGTRDDFMPEKYIHDPEILAKIKQMPMREQQAIAELMNSRMNKQMFFAMKNPQKPAELGLDMIPSMTMFLPPTAYEEFYNLIKQSTDMVSIKFAEYSIRFIKTPNIEQIFKYLDGNRSLREIFKKVMQNGKGNFQSLLDEFRPVYEIMHNHYAMFLRKDNIAAYENPAHMQERIKKLHGLS